MNIKGKRYEESCERDFYCPGFYMFRAGGGRCGVTRTADYAIPARFRFLFCQGQRTGKSMVPVNKAVQKALGQLCTRTLHVLENQGLHSGVRVYDAHHRFFGHAEPIRQNIYCTAYNF